MPLNWIDVSDLSFNSLLLLERAQLSWFPGWLPEQELALALYANPAVDWYLQHKCPEIIPWLKQVQAEHPLATPPTPQQVRQAELKVMSSINDLLVYVIDPAIYDTQPFNGWDSDELRNITDFRGKLVIDIGSGTGRLALVAAESAWAVFAVEPVANLRHYLKHKARTLGFSNIFPVDGLIADLPFPAEFADITMGGHVFGTSPEAEYTEMKRVTKPGGMLILCPGTSLEENTAHAYLLSQGFDCAQYEEPGAGMKRKYWKQVTVSKIPPPSTMAATGPGTSYSTL